MSIPLLRFHKPTRQHYCWNPEAKARVYFGRDAKLARQRYAAWLASNGGPDLPPPDRMNVADVVSIYGDHADARYTDPRERGRIAVAMATVLSLFDGQPAASFRAKALREVRSHLINGGDGPRSRKYVNKLVRAIQTAWRWLAAEEFIPAEAAASVCMVRALGPGEGGAELPPVLPPPPGAVEATLPHLPATVAAMVRVQLLTGARPGEICRMRAGEVSRSPSEPVQVAGTGRTVAALKCGRTTVWMYAPGAHKTLRRGKARVVPIGPQAQRILETFLMGKAGDAIVFPPRTTSRTPYRPSSYARAVERAIKLAGCPTWSPLSLRHAAGTELAEQFDAHTAASVLGHAPGSSATYVYLEQSIRRAAEAAARAG